MVKPKVYVTRIIPDLGLSIVKENFDVEIHQSMDYPPSREEILEKIKDKDAILCLLTDKIDEEVMDAAPNLKVISTMSVGYDHIDIEAATKRGIYVTNTPGVLTDAVAELTIGLLLAITRRIIEADQLIRKGEWNKPWSPLFMTGPELKGKTLGIIGLGGIGTAVARKVKGFGMRIIYYSRHRKEHLEKELGIEYVDLETLLKESDFVSLHTALTKDTYHMIGEKELKMMKKTAYLINTARGAVVDTEALIKALKEGWIAGAALDVFEQEPLHPGHPLTKLENVVLAPHIGSATIEARTKMAEMSAKNLLYIFQGKMPLSLVNKEVLNIRPLEKVKML